MSGVRRSLLLLLRVARALPEEWEQEQQEEEEKGDTVRVTLRSSRITSFVRKSAPIVALYDGENFLLTWIGIVSGRVLLSEERAGREMYVLVHERGLPDAAVAEDYHLVAMGTTLPSATTPARTKLGSGK